MRAWLRERVGEGADVDAVSATGSLVHLERVSLPLGSRARVTLDRATVGLVRRQPRLESFEGRVWVGEREDPAASADVLFESSSRPAEGTWADGELRIARARWKATVAPSESLDGAARLRLTRTDWALEGGWLERGPTRVRFEGRGAFDADVPEAASLRLERILAGPLIDAAVALTGRSLALPVGVPLEAQLDGLVSLDPKAGVRAALRAQGRGFSVELDATAGLEDGALGGRVGAQLAPEVLLAGSVPAAALPRADDTISLDLALGGAISAPNARGSLSADVLGFRFGRRRFAPALVLGDLSGTLAIEGRSVTVHAQARAGEGTASLRAGAALAGESALEATLELVDVDAAWLATLGALLGLDPRRVPRAVRASAALTYGPADPRAVLARVWLATVPSALAVSLRFDDGGLGPLAVSGRLALDDARDVGLVPASGVVEVDGTVGLEARIWPGEVVRAAVRATAAELRVAVPGHAEVVLGDARALLFVHGGRVVWDRGEGRVLGGRIATAGVVEGAELEATVTLERAALGDLRLAGDRVGDVVAGLLTVRTRLRRRAGGDLEGRGRARLEEPVFPAVALAREALAPYGLEPPPPAGDRPVTARVELVRGRVRLRDLALGVPGCEATGHLSIGAGGALSGTVTLTLGRALLAKSPLLVLSTAVTDVLTVPVRLGGTVEHPRLDADLGACFSRLLVDNHVSVAAAEVARGVASWIGGGERPSGPPAPSAPPAPPGADDGEAAPAADGPLERALAEAAAAWAELER